MKWLLTIAAMLSGCGDFSPTRIHQKRSTASLRGFASALEGYASDMKQYPTTENGSDLVATLTPTYLKPTGWVTPQGFVDEWQRPLRYECWQMDKTAQGCDHYAVASAGADGRFSATPLRDVAAAKFDDADEDIVLRDGELVRYPAYFDERH
jgi:hypothetical protein